MRRASLVSVVVVLAAGSTNGCGGSKSSGAPAPEDPGAASASIGPIDVAAGQEETVCILKRLTNAEDIMATKFVADLAPGSHHLIVYKSTATEENLDPFACVPFFGLTDQSAVPIMLVGKTHAEYDFPPNVGMLLPAGQMLKIEAHYINTTAASLQGRGSFQITGMPASQATGYQAADFGFWGTTKIDIPPKSDFTTPVKFQTGIAGTNVFAVTSHQHELGTRVQVWQGTGAPAAGAAPDPASLVLDEQDWASPQVKNLDPQITFDGTNGFNYQCSWNNTTDQDVQFGESALNEMCFVGFLYYPSHGFDLCIDGHCKSRR